MKSEKKFRIVQRSQFVFIVEREVKEVTTKGYLWWKREIVNYVWKEVGNLGQIIYSYMRSHSYVNNHDKMIRFNNLESAKEFIESLETYPLYFY